jgi:ElaB/YqjD/DUF883 family membrane-anchored ribosome-binding protein
VETTTIDDELRNIVDHAAALLDALDDEGDARLAALRERVAGSIDTARTRLDDMTSDANRPSERAAAAFERWIDENPWSAVAIGAAVGLVIGMLLSRRRTPAARDGGDPP